ncbi:probable transcriptional regulatory protein Pmob_0807 isoform X3 [Montipora capricornis]|uniref:probable transcriptional regulatory protein Pmob_0807 isoform X3 n=1 Tax=Montipora capricornis TaxID=246305 RepID=UPI0035F216BD
MQVTVNGKIFDLRRLTLTSHEARSLENCPWKSSQLSELYDSPQNNGTFCFGSHKRSTESGADIRFNPRLEKLIERARSISMPKEKIESAIKSGAGTKDNPYEASMLEIKGPGGCGLIVQILTSSKVKTKNEINTILRKNGGLLKDGGSVTFQYDHKGVIATEDFLFTGDKHDLSDYPDKDTLDKAEEIAIEIGAENLFFYESESGARNIKFICPVEDTKQVYDQLTEKFPKEVISSELEYIPHTLVSLPNELLQQTAKLIETLEDHIDVVRVYDNIEQYQSTTCKLFGST